MTYLLWRTFFAADDFVRQWNKRRVLRKHLTKRGYPEELAEHLHFSLTYYFMGSKARDRFLKQAKKDPRFSPYELDAHVASVLGLLAKDDALFKQVVKRSWERKLILESLAKWQASPGDTQRKPPDNTIQSSEPLKKCRYCAEWIKAEAIVCRYCGREL